MQLIYADRMRTLADKEKVGWCLALLFVKVVMLEEDNFRVVSI